MSKSIDSIRLTQTVSDQIVRWRRDFHMHPELGFQEFRTSGIVADELRKLGLEVATGVGKTGVVGILGEGKPVIAIRADMDALPLQELNDVSYRSQTPGMMHACGHDAHTAILLGVANILAAMPDRPAGEIRFLFQPCEEMDDDDGKSGAYYMVQQGAMDNVDRVIALHVNSTSPAGTIIVQDGYISAAVDNFRGRIIGKGCHAAHPDEGVDPIFVAAQVVNALHGVRARRIDQTRPAVISLGSIHGGALEAGENVIPDEVSIAGTIRSADEATREKLWREVENAFALARAFGGDYEFTLTKGCPAVYNDPIVTGVMRDVVTDLYGANALIEHQPSMGGEDFSFMTQRAPGAMFMLGSKKDSKDRPHHNPYFDLDESSFDVGAAVLVETTLRLLSDLGSKT
jgi:amidohydrolase